MNNTILARAGTRHGGFTLIELMVVVVIVGILAGVGYPAYTQYVTRSNRQAARAMIYLIADRQEQYFQDNKSYAPDLTTLGFGDEIYIGRDGQEAGADDDNLIYQVSLVDPAADSYSIDAEPLDNQADRDTDCATLSFTSTGQRTASGGGSSCW